MKKTLKEKVKKISDNLLKEDIKTDKEIIKNNIKLTNDYNYNIIPIGMINEEGISFLKTLFKDKINDYYYVEIIND